MLPGEEEPPLRLVHEYHGSQVGTLLGTGTGYIVEYFQGILDRY